MFDKSNSVKSAEHLVPVFPSPFGALRVRPSDPPSTALTRLLLSLDCLCAALPVLDSVLWRLCVRHFLAGQDLKTE